MKRIVVTKAINFTEEAPIEIPAIEGELYSEVIAQIRAYLVNIFSSAKQIEVDIRVFPKEIHASVHLCNKDWRKAIGKDWRMKHYIFYYEGGMTKEDAYEKGGGISMTTA